MRSLIRLGLFQLTAGGLSVLFLGVLNRIMRVEMGMDLFVVSLVIGGGHYLGALVAIPFGYFSDAFPLAGYRRTVYILLGAFVTVCVLAGSPWVGLWLSTSPSPGKTLLTFGYFLLEGISTYVAGTAYLALITDNTSREERGKATGLIWTLLMIGIIATGISTSFVMRTYTFNGLALLFAGGAVLALAFSFIALAGQERRVQGPVARASGSLMEALRMVVGSPNSRVFAGFLLISMFSYFMQDVLLEPFGGEIFGFSPAETARFNAYMGAGVVLGMLVGGLRLIPRKGKRWVTALGVWMMIGSFAALAASAFNQSAQGLPWVIGLQGLGAGFFTVGGVSLMMDMTAREHTGLFVGAWTLVQALAKGPSSLVGGWLHNRAVGWGAGASEAYGIVFVFEGVGLLISLLLLTRVRVEAFQEEIVSLDELVIEGLNG